MTTFEPFLQVIHVSDLHIVADTFSQRPMLRGVLRLAQHWKAAKEYLEDGMAPHDVLAPDAFLDFAEAIGPQDPEWANLPTWLVDTGDLTTFGDDDSLSEGHGFLAAIHTRSKAAGAKALYGNHDAWPSDFPLVAGSGAIAKHKQHLLTNWYTPPQPRLSVTCDIPDGSGQVQLFGVDTVLHDRIANTRALGEVGKQQRQALRQLIQSNQGDARARHFRMLATHHPVHFEGPPLLRCGMVMTDDRDLASDTGGPGKAALIQLVLSGHTHKLFPEHETLPPTPRHCTNHPVLGHDQCQFVVGTLMQMDKFGKRGDCPHQAVVLRFYYSKQNQSLMLVQRLLAARTKGSQGTAVGPYELVPTSKRTPIEQMVFRR
jgi:hypothetical protein